MQVSFVYPAALWLLLIVPLLIGLALALPRRLSPRRFWGSLALRALIFLTLILALAGAQLVNDVTDLTTIFLIDSSDSVAPAARVRAETFAQDSLNAMGPDDKAGVIVFGENALVERTPSGDRVIGRLESAPTAARTNIADAIQLGLALLPADTHKRLVLLSDGGENAGRALDTARVAVARGVPISYLDLSSAGTDEALVADLHAPTSAREGQEFELVATIESTSAQDARLQIFGQRSGQDSLLLEQQVRLQPGANRFSLRLKAEAAGFQRYRAQIEPQTDNRSQNNQASALVRVDGPPRVLLVEGQPGEAENLRQSLAAANVRPQVVSPQTMPADLAGLGDYEAVVLVNVPANALPVKAVANLPSYVRDLGRGLIMIGGDRSFGVGGYGKTPIETAMPVYMDVRDREERPDLALIFVIDKSGSMDACHCSGPNRQSAQPRRGGTPKIDIAKDAVLQASAVLRESDTVGVVAFDSASHWVIDPQRGPSAEAVQTALAPVAPDGITNVRAGLQAAEDALKNVNARIKHVILLTDGWSSGGDNLDIAERMRQAGVTLSVVAAGSGSAEYLARVADAGGGRYYPAERMEDVPQIFVQETTTVIGNYLVETPFAPRLVASSPVLEGLAGGVPQLFGYNGTTPKETATVSVVGPDDAPVLAEWQYGLGRSIAWTSDAKGKWARDWIQWGEFPRFAAQLVGRALPRSPKVGVNAELRTEGTRTILDVQALGADGRPLDGMEMRATIVGAGGFAQEVRLSQVAPGEYRASAASPPQGTYLVQIVGTQGDRAVLQDTVGLVVPYSPEYRQGQSNPELLAELARATGGKRLASPFEVFEPGTERVTRAREIALPLLLLALFLLPFDIGLRRLMLRREDLGPLAAIVPGRKRPRPAPAPGATAASPPDSNPPPPPEHPIDERIDRLIEARNRARRRARGDE
jgi:Mg-chelatase subunit ChlD